MWSLGGHASQPDSRTPVTTRVVLYRVSLGQVPIYAVESWLALVFREQGQYWEALRGWYVPQ